MTSMNGLRMDAASLNRNAPETELRNDTAQKSPESKNPGKAVVFNEIFKKVLDIEVVKACPKRSGSAPSISSSVKPNMSALEKEKAFLSLQGKGAFKAFLPRRNPSAPQKPKKILGKITEHLHPKDTAHFFVASKDVQKAKQTIFHGEYQTVSHFFREACWDVERLIKLLNLPESAALNLFKSVQFLDLSWFVTDKQTKKEISMTDERLAQIFKVFPNLQELNLDLSHITNASYPLIEKMPHLKKLRLSCFASPENLPNPPHLEELHLFFKDLTDEDLEELKCPNLRVLNIGLMQLTDGSFLSNFPKLEKVTLPSAKDMPTLIKNLSQLEHLKELSLESMDVNLLQYLGAFEHLTQNLQSLTIFSGIPGVNIPSTFQITLDTITVPLLAKFQNLRALDLTYNEVGVPQLTELVKALPKLQELLIGDNIEGMNFKEEDLKEVHEAAPQLRIIAWGPVIIEPRYTPDT